MKSKKLTPYEQAIVNFYTGKWKRVYPVNSPFTVATFTQHYNTSRIGRPLAQTTVSGYLSKILHSKMGLIKPVVDDYTDKDQTDGRGRKFWMDSKVNFFKTPLGRKVWPELEGILITKSNLYRKIEELLDRDNIEITYRPLPIGYIDDLHKELSKYHKRLIKYQTVYDAVKIVIHKRMNIMPNSSGCHTTERKRRLKEMEEHGVDMYIDQAEYLRMTHNMPKPEFAVNEAIQDKLLDLPRGGAPLLIGTQGAIMAPSKKLRPQYHHLCVCNLTTAHILQKTSDILLTNVVGDAVDPGKSDSKFVIWEMLDISKNWNHFKERVDEKSLIRHASYLGDRHNLVKVVIMNSGSITGWTMKKNGLKANFERAIKMLVKKYPHMHIIAMQMSGGKRFAYRYFHQNIDEIRKT